MSPASNSESRQRARILVVEERREERTWLQQALSGVARLETCETPAAALDLVASDPVDLVVWCPGDDNSGPRLGARLRREHPSVDIVLLAAADQAEAVREAHPEAAFVLERPVAALELRQVAEQLLSHRELAVRARELEDHVRTAERCQTLAPCLDPGEVYPTALDLLLELLARRRGIALFRRPLPPQAMAFRGFSEDECSRLHHVLSEQKPIDPTRYQNVERVESGPLHAALRDAGFTYESLLVVPIHGDEGEAGIVWVLDDTRSFSDAEAQRAALVAEHAVTALRNAERYYHAKERAFIDDVTEIYNARYLLSNAENEIRRAQRYENPLSVLFLDLDRFKLVNDNHGHLIGSQTLRNLSVLLQQCVRQVDTLARYGGDEFTILLIDTPHDTAMTIAERIRRTVEEHRFEAGPDAHLKLTISIGVATFPEHASERDPLLDAADKAMYRAKSLGRNRVCSAFDL